MQSNMTFLQYVFFCDGNDVQFVSERFNCVIIMEDAVCSAVELYCVILTGVLFAWFTLFTSQKHLSATLVCGVNVAY